jgi:hypothetical protein
MNSSIRQPICFALLAFCPGFVFAQSGATNATKAADPNDTVDLARMQVYYQSADAAAGTGHGAAVGTSAFNDEMSMFQSQNNVNNMVGSAEDLKQMRNDYKKMMDEATMAVRSTDPKERAHLYDNYLYDSRVFLRDHFDPSYALWVQRAIAALVLNKPATGAQAGQILLVMPAQQRAEPRVQRILAVLVKQGWLPKDAVPTPAPAPAGK